MSDHIDRQSRAPARTRSASRDTSSARWAAWFDGLTLTNEPDGTTLIRGPVADQAALHGLLQKVRDTGLPLVSVTQSTPTSHRAPTSARQTHHLRRTT